MLKDIERSKLYSIVREGLSALSSLFSSALVDHGDDFLIVRAHYCDLVLGNEVAAGTELTDAVEHLIGELQKLDISRHAPSRSQVAYVNRVTSTFARNGPHYDVFLISAKRELIRATTAGVVAGVVRTAS
jgi:hypothetical protein